MSSQFSAANVCSAIGDYIRMQSPGVAVYSAGAPYPYDIPASVNSFPSIVVYPGAMQVLVMSHAQTRTYAVNVDVIVGRGNVGSDVGAAVVIADQLCNAMLKNITISDNAWVTDISMSGVSVLDYAGIDYVGTRIVLSVVESQRLEVEP